MLHIHVEVPILWNAFLRKVQTVPSDYKRNKSSKYSLMRNASFNASIINLNTAELKLIKKLFLDYTLNMFLPSPRLIASKPLPLNLVFLQRKLIKTEFRSKFMANNYKYFVFFFCKNFVSDQSLQFKIKIALQTWTKNIPA